MNRWIKSFLIMPALLLGSVMANDAVRYHIDIDRAVTHEARVSIDFPTNGKNEMLVRMPAWRTGRYQILDLANGVRDFAARNQHGEVLLSEKIDKSTWRIQSRATDKIKVSYDLYANELGLRVRHIDDSHAFLDASGVFLYSDESRALPVQVQLNVPAGWASRSGMASCGEHCFVAAHYDELIDAPIETGVHQFASFTLDEKQYEVVLWGEGNFSLDKIVADYKKMIPTVTRIFGQTPFKRYVFMIHATDDVRGATEHVNSTIVQVPRWSFSPRKEYLDFLRTSTHEFFHTWNVKAYRPKSMVPYEYQSENYTDLLWLAEGSTSYFDELLTFRAGLQTRDEYFAQLGKYIDEYRHTPGRLRMSAAQASFDEWIHNTQDKDRLRNANVGIYTQGELLGLMFDLAIRDATQGKHGWEDVHRDLYQQFSVAKGGFDSADLKNVLRPYLGKATDTWWRDHVIGYADMPFDRLLAAVGLQHKIEASKDAERQQDWWSGIVVREESDKERLPVIVSVENGSPAAQAGLVGGDIIASLNGLRVTAKTFDERIAGAASALQTVHFFRRDRLQQSGLTLLPRPAGKPKLQALAQPTATQMQLNAAWLGQPWPKK